MLSVTDRAKRHLHSHLYSSENGDVKGKCFRIVPTAHDLFLTVEVERPKPEDKTYTHRGKTILALPKKLQRVCSDRKLNISDEGKLILV